MCLPPVWQNGLERKPGLWNQIDMEWICRVSSTCSDLVLLIMSMDIRVSLAWAILSIQSALEYTDMHQQGRMAIIPSSLSVLLHTAWLSDIGQALVPRCPCSFPLSQRGLSQPSLELLQNPVRWRHAATRMAQSTYRNSGPVGSFLQLPQSFVKIHVKQSSFKEKKLLRYLMAKMRNKQVFPFIPQMETNSNCLHLVWEKDLVSPVTDRGRHLTCGLTFRNCSEDISCIWKELHSRNHGPTSRSVTNTGTNHMRVTPMARGPKHRGSG